MDEKERNSIMSLHNRMKQKEDDDQIRFLKKGLKEGTRYMIRGRGFGG